MVTGRAETDRRVRMQVVMVEVVVVIVVAAGVVRVDRLRTVTVVVGVIAEIGVGRCWGRRWGRGGRRADGGWTHLGHRVGTHHRQIARVGRYFDIAVIINHYYGNTCATKILCVSSRVAPSPGV